MVIGSISPLEQSTVRLPTISKRRCFALMTSIISHNCFVEQAEEGDTVITLEVSRLARSTKQLCEIIEVIRSKHLRLEIVGSITVDCSNGQIDPMTNAFIQMSGVFAELELCPFVEQRQLLSVCL